MKKTFLKWNFLILFLFPPCAVFSHGGYIINFQGIGINPAFVAHPEYSDYTLNLSYRKGFFSYLSLYGHAEAGRMMNAKNWYGQIGADAMILMIGIQSGGMWVHQPQKKNNHAWGGYLGLSGGMPVSKNIGFFMSTERNFYFSRRDDFYLRAGLYFGTAHTR